MQAEAVHLALYVGGDGKQVDGVGREEGLYVDGDPEGSVCAAGPGGDERWELRVGYADTGFR